MIAAVLGSIGGIVAFIGGVWVIARGIFKLITSTDENTDAIKKLSARLENAVTQVNGHEVRIRVLEDRGSRGPRG